MIIPINRHGDHEASCLCCENLGLSYDPGYSSYTPGDGPQLYCKAGCFSDTSYLDGVHGMARTCQKFAPKAESS